MGQTADGNSAWVTGRAVRCDKLQRWDSSADAAQNMMEHRRETRSRSTKPNYF